MTLLWDWNGTLLDDIDVCISCMNILLKKYGLAIIESKEDYRSKFTFPITEYYKNLGWNFTTQPFSAIGKEFINLYMCESINCSLIPNAQEVIKKIDAMGITQVVLSASHIDNLKKQVHLFPISELFTDILGINTIYASSKIDIAQKWKDSTIKHDEKLIMIGDTAHDYEVSQALKCTCILFTNGHQKIEKTNYPKAHFIDDLCELETLL